jgi:hypothetical protein
MNYQTIYNSLINKAKLRNWTRKNTDIYLERHHIIPRSLGGDDSKENLVFLTAREHFLAHWLLFKIKSGIDKSKMANAWFRMCQQNDFQIRYSKHYEKARLAFSKHNPFKEKEVINIVKDRMTKNNPMKRPEVASKVSDKLKGLMIGEKNGFYGKKHNKETLKKISGENHYTKKEGHIPISISEEHKKAISTANKGRRRKDLSQRNKENSASWIISTPDGSTFKIKNLNEWAKENQVKPFWLYKNCHGYKAIKI